MATWRTAVQGVAFNADAEIRGATDRAADWIHNLVAGVEASAIGLAVGGRGVVGINVNKIPAIRHQIEAYVANIEKNLEKVKTTANVNTAIKGTQMEKAVTYYISALVSACRAYTSHLLAFSDQLVEVQKAYSKADVTMASSITKSGKQVESQAKRYQQKY